MGDDEKAQLATAQLVEHQIVKRWVVLRTAKFVSRQCGRNMRCASICAIGCFSLFPQRVVHTLLPFGSAWASPDPHSKLPLSVDAALWAFHVGGFECGLLHRTLSGHLAVHSLSTHLTTLHFAH